MTISKIITSACFILLSLTLAKSQESPLPQTVPAKLEITLGRSNAMARFYEKFSISGNVLKIEEMEMNRRKPKISTTRVSADEVKDLYRVFVENHFDSLENIPREELIYDAPSGSISISFADYSRSVSFGQNSPFDADGEKRYSAISQAIFALVERHRKRQ